MQIPESIRLQLGCGRNIRKGWVNLDIVKLEGVDVVADLDACATTPLPFADSSVEEFLAEHLIEHLKHPMELMQELHRIAKPNATALFRVPYGSSDDAFEDPTHVRQYFLNSFGYFSQPFYWRADYGYRGDWSTEKITLFVDGNRHKNQTAPQILNEVHTLRNIVKEMAVQLRAVKPARAPKRELQNTPHIEFTLT